MKLKIKLAKGAKMPTVGTNGSAGFDLYPIGGSKLNVVYGEQTTCIDTGVSIEIPKGYVGLVFERSSLQALGLSLSNKVGVIDSDYRGTIKLMLRSRLCYDQYLDGRALAQLVIVPFLFCELEEVEALSETARGAGGFGSTE